ncbi:MAG: PdxA family protein [Planctomycetota bacterium]
MKPRLAVPQGDLGGIGPEVALRVLSRPGVRAACRPLLIGHRKALEAVTSETGIEARLASVANAEEGFGRGSEETLPVLELENPVCTDPPGRPSAAAGRCALEALLRGGELCLQGRAEALVTPPVSKESLHLAGFPYEGQTGILGELSRVRRYGMLACAEKLQVLVGTRHMALRAALDRLDVGLVAAQVRLAHEAARETLGLEEPRIVLAALNPHAGENGAFGKEEQRILRPALERVRAEWGFETAGPAVPDVVFREGAQGRWDVVVALYHDQAFLPLKMLDRRRACTIFVGGPLLRVSPVHGTAFDIARTGAADPEPFAYALARALALAKTRAGVPDGQ